MMLFDRLFRHAARSENTLRRWDKHYRGLPVYDLSAVYAAGQARKFDNPGTIPQRLPHDYMWLEWTYRVVSEALRGFSTWQTGLTTILLGDVNEWPESRGLQSILIDEKEDYHYYIFTEYSVLVDTEVSTDLSLILMNRMTVLPGHWLMRFNKDWTGIPQCDFLELANDSDTVEWSRRCFGLSVCPPFKTQPTTGEMWTVAAFAALLNCRNIVVEDTPQPKLHQKVRGEREHRPYCTYKVLKLEVPHTVGKGGESTGDGPKQRFHMCRGHFKNLQADRYKNKGWHWWPAHWRGDIDLGRADKSYKITPGDKP